MKFSKYLSALPRLDGRTIVVTGANSGIGLQTIKHLAWLGANVIMACRSAKRADAAIALLDISSYGLYEGTEECNAQRMEIIVSTSKDNDLNEVLNNREE